MSSLDEILTLENKIHDLVKVVDEAKLKNLKEDEEIKKHTINMEGIQARVLLHSGNLKHMRSIADYVDVNEYAKVLQHLHNSEDSLEDARVAIKHAQHNKVRLQQTIDKAQALISENKRLLSGYGRLLQFPK